MAVIKLRDFGDSSAMTAVHKKKLSAEIGEATRKRLMKLIVQCHCSRKDSAKEREMESSGCCADEGVVQSEKKKMRRRRRERKENGVGSSDEDLEQEEEDEGFFRRSIQQKIQYRPCTKNQQCSILRINRNRCQYCRLRKCIAVGMSRDAVRFGRVPKREKARILAAMHQSCQSRSAERAAVAEQLNGVSANQVNSPANPSATPTENGNPTNQPGPHVEGEPKEEVGSQDWKDPNVVGPAEEVEGPEDELEANRLANTVLRAHSDTCHFAHLRPKEGQGCPRAGPQAAGGPVYSVQGRNGPILACPLNPRRPLVAGLTPDPNGRGEDTLLQDFSQRFSPAIRGVVEFAKRIPGFALLSQSDQVTLLKAGVFEVLLLRLACLFDAQTNTMTCLNGELLRRESIVSHSPSSSPSHSPSHASNARFLVDSMFEFAARLNSLQLSDAELALFSAVVIIAPDRPGLRHTDLISRIHSRLLSSLSLLLSHSHPSPTSPPALLNTLQSYIPDLRTLNTLHSEKLLAFKMTEQQNQSDEHHMHHRQPCATQQRLGAEEMPEHCKQQQFSTQGRQHVVQQPSHAGGRPVPQNCPAHAQPQCPQEGLLPHHAAETWKDDDVQELDDDEVEEEERWRANGRNAALSAVMSGLKSPLGSVSSSESVCSGEVASLSEFRSSVSASAPLLAASLSGNNPAMNAMAGFPKRRRHRDRSGSNSEEDTSCGGIQTNPCAAQVTQMSAHRTYFRKLDSPSDSGIESGTERLEKSSTSTSVCSSPRSSLEDKDDAMMQQHKVAVATQQQRRCPHLERTSAVEDMPVLKRVLQAPPLYDTNSLMDEAYKPHKKFRALRKDCAEAEAMGNSPVNIPSSPGMVSESPRPCRLPEKPAYASLEPVRMRPESDNLQVRSDNNMSSPPIVVLSPPSNAVQPASPHSIISTLNMHFPQITIHAQPMRNPSPVENHALSPQRNLPSPSGNRLSPHAGGSSQSNPPLLLQKALLQPPANQRSLQSHQHQALLSALSGDSSPRPVISPQSSPLTASLLSAPTLSSSLSSTHSTLARSLMEGPKMTAEQMKRTDIIHSYIMREGNEEASGSQSYRKACPQAQSYQPKPSPDPAAEDGAVYRQVKQAYRPPAANKESGSSQAPGVLVFNGSYLHMGWSNAKQQSAQETQGYSSPSPGKQPTEVKQAGQPLNLSKKTPPPSPATTPVVSASVLEA